MDLLRSSLSASDNIIWPIPVIRPWSSSNNGDSWRSVVFSPSELVWLSLRPLRVHGSICPEASPFVELGRTGVCSVVSRRKRRETGETLVLLGVISSCPVELPGSRACGVEGLETRAPAFKQVSSSSLIRWWRVWTYLSRIRGEIQKGVHAGEAYSSLLVDREFSVL